MNRIFKVSRQYIPAILVLIIGVSFAAISFYMVGHIEFLNFKAMFVRDARNRINAIEREIEINLAAVQNLWSFYISSREAVELYEEAMRTGESFDAVILDLTVPGGMGGKEAIGKLREIDPDIIAIVSSGYSGDPVMSNFREYGFSDVIVKPYNPEQMKVTLYGVLSGKRQ